MIHLGTVQGQLRAVEGARQGDGGLARERHRRCANGQVPALEQDVLGLKGCGGCMSGGSTGRRLLICQGAAEGSVALAGRHLILAACEARVCCVTGATLTTQDRGRQQAWSAAAESILPGQRQLVCRPPCQRLTLVRVLVQPVTGSPL